MGGPMGERDCVTGQVVIRALLVLVCASFARAAEVKLTARETPLAKIDPLILPNTDLATTDARHIAFAARAGKGQRWVLDGKPQPEWPAVGMGAWSPDGAHFAYLAGNAGQPQQIWHVFDGVRGTSVYSGNTDNNGDIRWSPSGAHWIYAAWKGEKACVVVDGKESDLFDHFFGRIEFSPDGSRWATTVVRGENNIVLMDGKEFAGYDGIVDEPIRFTADGKRFAFM